MNTRGFVLVNTTIVGVGVTPAVSLPTGMQGVIVCQTGAGLDPALTQMSVNLRLGGQTGSGYVVASSSKVLSSNCMLGPLYFPAGEYVVRTLGGSSVVGAFIGIFPTV